MRRSILCPSVYSNQGGVASILLLFAMSAFSVLGVATLTTRLGESQSGNTFALLHQTRDGASTKFVAPLVVPNAWRVQGTKGSYSFQLPVLVPENGIEQTGSTGAWHEMSDSEVPGMAVCCESQKGVCAGRHAAEAQIADWTPSANDAQWLSVDLASQPDSNAKSDLVTATIAAAARDAAPNTTAISCQLELQGAVIAKGFAHLRQTPRQDASELSTDVVDGTMDIAVRTK